MFSLPFQISPLGFMSTSNSTKVGAIFLTQDSVLCEVTGSLPVSGYMLSVSNDGVNQSTGVYYIIQDPVCYNCVLEDQTCYLQVPAILFATFIIFMVVDNL